jgi:uncharacterized protein
MPTKTCAVKVKATAADDTSLKEGQFIALASVFNNIDAVGDVVMPGAFADDLKSWQTSGDVIPVLWGHQMNDPNMNIGEVLHADETGEGLQVKAQLDLDNPVAAQVYKLLKGRRVGKMSFAYDIEDGAPAERAGQSVYELRKLKLHEVSVVQVPANPAATVQQVKEAAERARAAHVKKGAQQVGRKDTGIDAALASAVSSADAAIDQAMGAVTAADTAMDDLLDLLKLPDPDADEPAEDEPGKESAPSVKAGRTISAKNESTLRSAMGQITKGVQDVMFILDALNSSDDGKASPTRESATAEEPDGAKTDQPISPGTASLRLRTDIDLMQAEIISLTD